LQSIRGLDNRPMPHVVFVCEHGAAKSVLAATYFNQLAARSGLSLRALARGVSPDSEIPPGVAHGLAREGLAPCVAAPIALAAQDLADARQVITFDQPQLAALAPKQVTVTAWNDLPPVSTNFDLARDAILSRVQALVTELNILTAPGET
jgi:protein-tyrosine-phosphatase